MLMLMLANKLMLMLMLANKLIVDKMNESSFLRAYIINFRRLSHDQLHPVHLWQTETSSLVLRKASVEWKYVL